MNRVISFTLIITFFSFLFQNVYAQNNIQPSIMVVPWKKEGESYRKIIEEKQHVRSATSIINQAFLERGFRTIDFMVHYQTMKEDRILENANQQSIEQTVAENTNADIIVRVDGNMNHNSLGGYAEIILAAIDRQTSQNLSNQTCTSGEFRSAGFELLAKNALQNKNNSCLDNFLEMMQTQFIDIRKNGRPLKVSITYHEDSDYNGDTDIGDDFDVLSDLLKGFFLENAHNRYVRFSIMTATKFECDDFRIPLRDPENPDYPYDASNILSKFRKHFGKKYGIYCSGSLKGGSLNITICGSQKCN